MLSRVLVNFISYTIIVSRLSTLLTPPRTQHLEDGLTFEGKFGRVDEALVLTLAVLHDEPRTLKVRAQLDVRPCAVMVRTHEPGHVL